MGFRRWLSQGLRANRPIRRERGPAFRPRLEALEDRFLPSTLTVLNLNDSGPGSLRQTIANAASGDTINFQPGLSGTIGLTSGEIAVNKNLTITGPGAGVLAISG